MGFYIETESPKNKTAQIMKMFSNCAETDYDFVKEIMSKSPMWTKTGVVVVIEHPDHESAGFAFDPSEFRKMTAEDGLSRKFIIMRREDAAKASGYSK